MTLIKITSGFCRKPYIEKEEIEPRALKNLNITRKYIINISRSRATFYNFFWASKVQAI